MVIKIAFAPATLQQLERGVERDPLKDYVASRELKGSVTEGTNSRGIRMHPDADGHRHGGKLSLSSDRT